MTNDDVKMLRWRCRRGMRELDLLLTRFLDTEFDSLNAPLRHAFAELLECDDQDILDWLMGRAEPPGDLLRELIARLRD
jgi:antitoxin CptB